MTRVLSPSRRFAVSPFRGMLWLRLRCAVSLCVMFVLSESLPNPFDPELVKNLIGRDELKIVE
jgi:hypothetical protein